MSVNGDGNNFTESIDFERSHPLERGDMKNILEYTTVEWS